VVLLVGIVLGYQDALYSGIPFILKAALVLPIIAVLLTLFSIYTYVKRIKAGEASTPSHIYYGVVILAGAYMAVYYYYWNILGWNYY
ncbi:hypothetical protein SB749_18880, partial [Brevibacterium sp. SIMBA_078]|uniref:hypothetical protein n=1 Tax=Brevibacterium sp. SIMBA_078 TaxID=3085816 RepID=UPI00397941B8